MANILQFFAMRSPNAVKKFIIRGHDYESATNNATLVVNEIKERMRAMGFAKDEISRSHLVIEEAVINAIKHGNYELNSREEEKKRLATTVQRNRVVAVTLLHDLFEKGDAEKWLGRPFPTMKEPHFDDESQRELFLELRDRYEEKRTQSSAVLEIQVQDQGKGFDPASIPDPTLPENLDVEYGRGLLLMKSFFPDHDIPKNEIGTLVILRAWITWKGATRILEQAEA